MSADLGAIFIQGFNTGFSRMAEAREFVDKKKKEQYAREFLPQVMAEIESVANEATLADEKFRSLTNRQAAGEAIDPVQIRTALIERTDTALRSHLAAQTIVSKAIAGNPANEYIREALVPYAQQLSETGLRMQQMTMDLIKSEYGREAQQTEHGHERGLQEDEHGFRREEREDTQEFEGGQRAADRGLQKYGIDTQADVAREGHGVQKYGIDTQAEVAREGHGVQRYGIDTQAGVAREGHEIQRHGIDTQADVAREGHGVQRYGIDKDAEVAREGISSRERIAEADRVLEETLGHGKLAIESQRALTESKVAGAQVKGMEAEADRTRNLTQAERMETLTAGFAFVQAARANGLGDDRIAQFLPGGMRPDDVVESYDQYGEELSAKLTALRNDEKAATEAGLEDEARTFREAREKTQKDYARFRAQQVREEAKWEAMSPEERFQYYVDAVTKYAKYALPMGATSVVSDIFGKKDEE